MNAVDVVDEPTIATEAQEEDSRGWIETETTAVVRGDGVLYKVSITRTIGEPDVLLDIKCHHRDVGPEEYLLEGLVVPAAELDVLLSCFARLGASQVKRDDTTRPADQKGTG